LVVMYNVTQVWNKQACVLELKEEEQRMASRFLGVSFALCLINLGVCGCAGQRQNMSTRLRYNAIEREIKVDGDVSDWSGIKGNVVEGREHLWIGQDLIAEKWKGNEDQSFSWKAAWFKNALYFLVEVTDDNFQSCIREFSWLNDSIEIQLDPRNLEGPRIEGADQDTPLEQRIGKKLRGYEMHFVPCAPSKVYLDDTKAVYRLENSQNSMFAREWDGQIEARPKENGYLLEIGFAVPGLRLKNGMIMGLDVTHNDDDGNGRKSLMTWTGRQVPFWITMDYFGKMKLVK